MYNIKDGTTMGNGVKGSHGKRSPAEFFLQNVFVELYLLLYMYLVFWVCVVQGIVSFNSNL